MRYTMLLSLKWLNALVFNTQISYEFFVFLNR
ncbi:hypothetical protein Nhal_1274 [Nitrosococcus halophilus Nc 4]|uniref:Uncharacterized protein n=1 Tax=Nitrosococcus halophilus (strain Nc4) TaxID=472759 RepID=D5C0A3_NITHN|nr:hypothetical protein Nhal_1274 [Nitrosococcus halophilus Nc 4]